jgi:signal transduction histidine kinase
VCETAHKLGSQQREKRADVQVASFTAVRSSGEEFPIEASVSCLETPAGRSYTLIVRDISERRRAEQALREQALSLERTMRELKALNEELNERQAALEQAMSARSRFYASMSHELRTPINAVLGYRTLLLENIYGPLNEKQQEGIERTQKAARHLLELVNDVLDLSKIEAGKIDLRLQPVAIPSLVEDLFVTVRPLADQYGSTLTLEQPSTHPLRVVSDPRRVRQILLNLLSNAIKFGNGKPVRCDEAGAGRSFDATGVTSWSSRRGTRTSPPWRASAVAGSTRRKVLPPPTRDSTCNEPCSNSARRREIGRPSPVPS